MTFLRGVALIFFVTNAVSMRTMSHPKEVTSDPLHKNHTKLIKFAR